MILLENIRLSFQFSEHKIADCLDEGKYFMGKWKIFFFQSP